MLCNYFFAQVVDFGTAYWVEFVCITVLLTFLLLLFGEIMPKVYCGQHALAFCRKAAGSILFCRKLFYPFASILLRSGMLAEKVVPQENHLLSVDDLEQALELTDKEDIKEEQRILEGIVRFGDETAKEIMTSRQDVVDLDFTSSFADVLKCIVENNYSRIPVYQDNPETKKIDDLLREVQENKIHIAVVVDEFGGMSGIVTLEDVLEEIVGEINDEYDEDEKSYVRINSNTFVFEGKTLLSDVYKILKLDDETFEEVQGEADTLAGLLLEIKGDFPQLNEKLDFENFTFEVLEMDERRILKVKVIIHEKKGA